MGERVVSWVGGGTVLAAKRVLEFTLNEEPFEVACNPNRSLAEVLREDLGMTGAKTACGMGVCGSCGVMMDGWMIGACLTLVLRVTGVNDTGKVINPKGVAAQLEGGVLMGVGCALTEGLEVEGGQTSNASFVDYKLPATLDAPALDIALIETEDPNGPWGAKGLGKMAQLGTSGRHRERRLRRRGGARDVAAHHPGQGPRGHEK